MERIELSENEISCIEYGEEYEVDRDYPIIDVRSRVIVTKTGISHRRIILKRRLDKDIRGAFEVITPSLTMLGYLSSDKMSIIEY